MDEVDRLRGVKKSILGIGFEQSNRERQLEEDKMETRGDRKKPDVKGV